MKEDKTEDEEEIRPEKEDIDVLGEIAGVNAEGLGKLAREEKSQELRDSNKYVRKFRALYRKYFRRKRADTQKIKA